MSIKVGLRVETYIYSLIIIKNNFQMIDFYLKCCIFMKRICLQTQCIVYVKSVTRMTYERTIWSLWVKWDNMDRAWTILLLSVDMQHTTVAVH